MRISVSVALVSLFFSLSGWANKIKTPAKTAKSAAVTAAQATLQALGQSGVTGTVKLTEVEGGVKIEAVIEHLPSNTTHGFHVHEKGDCSSVDGASAGGHFNPTSQKHGAPHALESHMGDLGNVQADKDGKVTLVVVKKGATLRDGSAGLMGRAFIVHANADDLQTQPTGNAGGRIACGVIMANTP